ncbi:unnamed protein product [Pleuronectes platessa]|uniref:Uncharacterized protein n=1 Tax=Pleuronectes platessa TaxID=8262 RepID=A0A9N7YBM0_PLEPL|nr:unnamed protein product [Pleuronectes platessa]
MIPQTLSSLAQPSSFDSAYTARRTPHTATPLSCASAERRQEPKTPMTGSTPARLKVIFRESNVEKRTLPDGIQNSLDDLLSKIKNTFGLEGNIRVQYMDPDFGNDFLGPKNRMTLESLEKERLELQRQVSVRNNERVIADKMALTFAYSRKKVENKEPSLKDFKERWHALFQQREINAEFQRLMAVPLEEKFMAKLDMHSSELIRVIRSKGGAHARRLLASCRHWTR